MTKKRLPYKDLLRQREKKLFVGREEESVLLLGNSERC
jgi:hypothetical protein